MRHLRQKQFGNAVNYVVYSTLRWQIKDMNRAREKVINISHIFKNIWQKQHFHIFGVSKQHFWAFWGIAQFVVNVLLII